MSLFNTGVRPIIDAHLMAEYEKKRSYKLTAKREIHGMNRTPEHRAWLDMKRRCLNPNKREARWYTGMKIDETWVRSFFSFYEHIGPRPCKGYSVDRIDNTRGYVPGNVRWATWKEQQNNRRVRTDYKRGKNGQFVQ